MKLSRNRWTLALICTSTILMLALQTLWLRNAYEKAYYDLGRDVNSIFRNTVLTMRDSVMMRSLVKVPDSTNNDERVSKREMDSLPGRGSTIHMRSRVRIVFPDDTTAASPEHLVKRFAPGIREGKVRSGNFLFVMRADSLSEDSLQHHFGQALAISEMPLTFEILHEAIRPGMRGPNRDIFAPSEEHRRFDMSRIRPFSNTLHSEWVYFDPFHRYSVDVFGARRFLLSEITPQILFSGFVTLLTIAAFAIMYRSLVAQERLMIVKNDFISNVAHELQTPLTTAGVAVEAIRSFRGQGNPELASEYLDIAQNELYRLSLLTDRILKAAIFEDRGLDVTTEPVDMDELICEVLKTMDLVFQKHRAKVEYQKEGTDFQVNGGRLHLTNVVYNLLDNAIKYSGRSIVIRIRLVGEVDRVTLSIKDEGIGIAPEFRRKVFEKFFRIPAGDVHNVKGYGLGLSYVQSVVTNYRGSITVHSEPGKGSEFVLELPK